MEACPVCKQLTWEKDNSASAILDLPTNYLVLFCQSCGVRKLHPQLDENEIFDLYSGSYFDNTISLPERFNLNGVIPSPGEYLVKVAHSRIPKFQRVIDQLKVLYPDGKTLLDVGAATGDFVKTAKDAEILADGIELSEYAVAQAKQKYGINLQNTPLSEVKNDLTYDFIHLNHVFEHFNDPVSELRHISRLLARDGIFYIEIPYQFHLLEKLLFKVKGKAKKFTLLSLHHPFFYTPKTIVRLLESQGFQVIKMRVFDPQRYEDKKIPQKIKKGIWYFLSWLSIGNYIEVYAKHRL